MFLKLLQKQKSSQNEVNIYSIVKNEQTL